jgi:hypothetical protein
MVVSLFDPAMFAIGGSVCRVEQLAKERISRRVSIIDIDFLCFLVSIYLFSFHQPFQVESHSFGL